MPSTFQDIIDFRRSNRAFDPSVSVPDAVIQRSLERAVLSPNSSNMQLWEFYWIGSAEALAAMAPLCLNQQAARTARQMVVFVTRRDKWRLRVRWHLEHIRSEVAEGTPTRQQQKMVNYYRKVMPLMYFNDWLGLMGAAKRLIGFVLSLRKPFFRPGGRAEQRIVVHKSCALAAQTFMLSVASEGFHTCPMEGFDGPRLKRYLGLPRGAEINMVVAVGKGTQPGVWGPRIRVPFEAVVFRR